VLGHVLAPDGWEKAVRMGGSRNGYKQAPPPAKLHDGSAGAG
jgi:hypothetical protein